MTGVNDIAALCRYLLGRMPTLARFITGLPFGKMIILSGIVVVARRGRRRAPGPAEVARWWTQVAVRELQSGPDPHPLLALSANLSIM